MFTQRFVLSALLAPAGLIGLAVPHAAASESGRLAPDQVLVVYDSRQAESVAIAEHYAGSMLVPGGAGNESGVHAGLHVFDIASAGLSAFPSNGTVDWSRFVRQVRDPIRAHLVAEGLDDDVRCLVLTKGIPHRVLDTDDSFVGERTFSTPSYNDEWKAGDATFSSVDSELTLLWQDLESGEAGGTADSFSDGYIANPYWRSGAPIASFDNASASVAKALSVESIPAWPGGAFSTTEGPGAVWGPGAGSPETTLTAGDIVLVTRLDGHSVADVRAGVERARDLRHEVGSAKIILDEAVFAFPDGADLVPNGEWDNWGGPVVRSGDDYELTEAALLQDGRFTQAEIVANETTDYSLGPLIAYPGGTFVVSEPVLYLAHFAQAHNTWPGQGTPNPATRTYAESFAYADGAVFNGFDSFNARDFAGLGTRDAQEQIADFLAAGGTFAVGMAWGDMISERADNQFIVERFLLGGLTWAEAAWGAIPALSWSHIVLGDPLATVCLSTEDLSGDRSLDFFDLLEFLALFDAGDPLADRDSNGTFDFFDVLAYLAAFEVSGC
ncbi:MAG: GC-type dockerin domain-anchored protein [Planctomycetota bacterium]